MTEIIILDICHSDDYTDYLFQTAALTNKRVFPMIDPGRDEIASHYTTRTTILHCRASRNEDHGQGEPVCFDEHLRRISVYPPYYLEDNGNIDSHKANYVRALIEKAINGLLLAPENLMEIYREYFPLLWKHRDTICSNPQYFFVKSGWRGLLFDDFFPLGVILKTIEDEHKNFRLSLRGDCGCKDAPLLIDYQYSRDDWHYLTLHSWCPICGKRRAVKTQRFLREGYCNSALESAFRYYDEGQGFSTISLPDIIDILRSE